MIKDQTSLEINDTHIIIIVIMLQVNSHNEYVNKVKRWSSILFCGTQQWYLSPEHTNRMSCRGTFRIRSRTTVDV